MTRASVAPPSAPEPRDLPRLCVLGLCALVDTALHQDLTGDLAQQVAAGALRPLLLLARASGKPVTLTARADGISVLGLLPCATRNNHELFRRTGKTLHDLGVAELVVDEQLSAGALLQLAHALAAAEEEPVQLDTLSQGVPGLRVTRCDPRLDPPCRRDEAPSTRWLDLYTLSTQVLRTFHDQLTGGACALPPAIERVAQRLVTASGSRSPALHGLFAMAGAHRDLAARAVQSALLAACVARQATEDPVLLQRVVVTALLADVGQVQGSASAPPGGDADEQRALCPALGAAVLLALGGAGAASRARVVGTFEAAWLERSALLGPLPSGSVGPLLSARIVHVARAYLELIAPVGDGEPLSPPEALRALRHRPDHDPVPFQALLAALGPIPAGTVVELSGGQWGVVVGPSTKGEAFDRPRVSLVTDDEGRAQRKPIDLDLGGASGASIARIVPARQARFNVARTFLG